ncbi:MAG: redoxin domain-containing protein, partial [Sulfolobaceae archaeon]
MKLKIGDQAPDFEGITDEGRKIRLSDFRGKFVILYFYPKDDTPGCRVEAMSFRDRYDDLQRLNAV